MADRLHLYKSIKTQAEQAQRAADRAAGALESAMHNLATDFGCESIAEAENLLKELKTNAADAATAADKSIANFEDTWGDALRKISNTD